MSDGTCYIYFDTSTIYAFNSLNCTDGDKLPTASQPYDIDEYKMINGRYVHTRSFSDTINSDFIAYTSHNFNDYSGVDMNVAICLGALFTILFFYVIYKWFIRMRG